MTPGQNPTDRGKSETKRSLLTDGQGASLAVVVTGANRHDKKLLEPTLEAILPNRPEPSLDSLQHLCLDKGYDYPDIRKLVEDWDFIEHIKVRGVEAVEKKSIPGYRARRWVVERTHSWINRFRKLLIRWEKKVENHLALLHLACAYITAPIVEVLG